MDVNAYTQEDKKRIDCLLGEETGKNRRKIVVLDDDPTGTQTVHDVPVYTKWDQESIEAGFRDESNIFFVLTNSRGLTEQETAALHTCIAKGICSAGERTGRDYILISRSDSTLRGHYPLETKVLKETIEKRSKTVMDGEVICPFFEEGGRYTRDNIHYVAYGDQWVRASDTEFAKDSAFGFKNSDLRLYIEEKTKGEYKEEDVVSISLGELRGLKISLIAEKLKAVTDFNKVIVNATDYYDLKVFCISLYRAMAEGKRFLFRTAASFVKVAAGIQERPLLTRSEMIHTDSQNGGIIIIGSYTDKTTKQLKELETCRGVECIEFNSDLVMDRDDFNKEVERVSKLCRRLISQGKTAAVYTKRKKFTGGSRSGEETLLCSVRISEGITSIAGRLDTVPLFVLAKGGITSSDVATKALGQVRSVVMGQILPGIPVWKTGNESRYPGIPYIVFPGNVGEEDSLRQAAERLLGYYDEGQGMECSEHDMP